MPRKINKTINLITRFFFKKNAKPLLKDLYKTFYMLPYLIFGKKTNNVYISRRIFRGLLQYSKKMLVRDTYFFSLIHNLCHLKMNMLKFHSFDKNTDVIVIAIVRNERKRIVEFIKYHRNIGIKQFAILDDHSDDGTREYLLEQPDVDVFSCDKRYSVSVQVAWVNYSLSLYGHNRWYLILDIDELFVYHNIEFKKIDTFISELQKNKITACSGRLLDMYSFNNAETDTPTEMENSLYKDYIYFDKNGYKIENNFNTIYITGGMRKRCFEIEQPCLSKTPLFYFDRQTVYVNPHYIYPYSKNYEYHGRIVLQHYKFLPDDLSRYRDQVKDKNMYDESREVVAYVKKMEEGISFYNTEKSVKYENSSTLLKYDILIN
jgi:hypothetical protein